MDIISRQQAQQLGLKSYYTGEPCKFGHITSRQVSNSICHECRIIKRACHYKENRKQCIERSVNWVKKNPEKRKEINRRYRERHPNKNKDWHINNREYHIEQTRNWNHQNPTYASNYSKEWRKNHPGWSTQYNIINQEQINANAAKRRAAKMKRKPSWLTKTDYLAISALFGKARQLSIEIGIKYVVDHEIPLQGKFVSGLHIPENLRVITENENATKHNKFDQDEISQKYYGWLKQNGL